MKATRIAIALMVTLGCGEALAAADGNELIVDCTDTVRSLNGQFAKSPFAAGSCLGQVSGVMDTLTIVNGSLPQKEQVCYPSKGIQYGQGVRIVLQYLNTHPAELHTPGAFLIVRAFRDAFPCGQ